MKKSALHPLHLADLRESGLTDQTIQEARIESVVPGRITKELRFNIPAIVSMYRIPYPGTDFSRYKCFYSAEKTGPKYLQRKDTSNRLFIPDIVRPIFDDTSVHLYVTEGEKKALKATQEGICCIGLSGLWNWKNKGSKELIADFDQITFEGRHVYIVPDNDWLQPNKHGYKKNLKQAVYGLTSKIKERGAKVFIVELPGGNGK